METTSGDNREATTEFLHAPTVPPNCDGTQRAHGRRNFSLIAFYQVVMRTGWIFKTESIIMPVVIDLMGGGAWLRGCLPMLSRLGQSVPPLFAAATIRRLPRKKYALAACTFVMGLMFLILSAIWNATPNRQVVWLPVCFLFLYAIFFTSTGTNQIVLSTLNGKLVRVNRRGRLTMVANLVGVVCAVSCSAILLPGWLDEKGDNFGSIFAFTGGCFVAAAVIALLLRETKDQPNDSYRQLNVVQSTIGLLKRDREFRALAILAALFGMSLTLLPHYQALARGRLELSISVLMWWVIAQNIGVAIISFPTGWLADRFGNRLVLQVLMLGMCVAPLLSLSLVAWGGGAERGFIIVFGLLGLTPVTMRTLSNYTLELASRDDQPKYLSVLSLCTAAPPILTSTFMGRMIEWFSFEVVFVLVTGLVFSGWLLSFRLAEPRHRIVEPLPPESDS